MDGRVAEAGSFTWRPGQEPGSLLTKNFVKEASKSASESFELCSGISRSPRQLQLGERARICPNFITIRQVSNDCFGQILLIRKSCRFELRKDFRSLAALYNKNFEGPPVYRDSELSRAF